jgi:carbonic anhydrase/acetyltransferase-like protein (isoleucine patch superfamily)
MALDEAAGFVAHDRGTSAHGNSAMALGVWEPRFGKDVFIQDNARVVGNVRLGDYASIWFGAVVRGDQALVEIGTCSNVQDLAVIHGLPGRRVQIGKNVSIGHQATVHGCTIGDRCLIGIGSVVLDGAVIGDDTIIGANSLVPGGKTYPRGVLLVGSPARVVRVLTRQELEGIRSNSRVYVDMAARYRRELAPVSAKANGEDEATRLPKSWWRWRVRGGQPAAL